MAVPYDAQTTNSPPAPVRSENFDIAGDRSGGGGVLDRDPVVPSPAPGIVKEILEGSAQEAGEISAGDAGITHAMGRNEGVEHRAEPEPEAVQAGQEMASERVKAAAHEPVSIAPAHLLEKSSEQPENAAAVSKPKLSLVSNSDSSRSLVSKALPAMKINNLEAVRTSAQDAVRTSEQGKKAGGQKAKKGSEQPVSTAPAHPLEKPEEWLKSILPTADGGWWEVRSEGKGYSVKFRWRSTEGMTALTFPRVSADQYRLLRNEGQNYARRTFTGRVLGHLEDLTFEPGRESKARIVAARLGFDLENDKAVGF